jgi:hypothetical protein
LNDCVLGEYTAGAMKSSDSGCGWWCRGAGISALAIIFALQFGTSIQPALAYGQSQQTGSPSISLNDYIDRLKSLDSLVAVCQKERNSDSCDAAKVGADLHVEWTAGGTKNEREIRFGWLRLLIDRAREKEKPSTDANADVLRVPGAKPQAPPPVTVDALLTQARDRLGDDEKQAAAIAGIPPPIPNRDQERKSLNAILAQKEYKTVTQVSWKERLLNALANWFNNLFARLADNGSRWPWAAFAFRILWIGALCLGLAWFLIRMERRLRARPGADPIPAPGAPSAREWQLWLADARRMAAEGRWREAIHFVYWASISRLESRRLWPADRAKTPREYILLLPNQDPHKPSLTTLTRSFERVWYGGRDAVAGDYHAALKLAADLGVK